MGFAIHQYESAIGIHVSPPSWIPLTPPSPPYPSRLSSIHRTPTDYLFYIWLMYMFEEGNGNPLQCSCLENPRDGGAWWAAVYGVAQSRARLKRFSSSSTSNVHVSILFCQIILPSPSPAGPKSLFFMSVSPFCPVHRIIGTIFLDSIYMG